MKSDILVIFLHKGCCIVYVCMVERIYNIIDLRLIIPFSFSFCVVYYNLESKIVVQLSSWPINRGKIFIWQYRPLPRTESNTSPTLGIKVEGG